MKEIPKRRKDTNGSSDTTGHMPPWLRPPKSSEVSPTSRSTSKELESTMDNFNQINEQIINEFNKIIEECKKTGEPTGKPTVADILRIQQQQASPFLPNEIEKARKVGVDLVSFREQQRNVRVYMNIGKFGDNYPMLTQFERMVDAQPGSSRGQDAQVRRRVFDTLLPEDQQQYYQEFQRYEQELGAYRLQEQAQDPLESTRPSLSPSLSESSSSSSFFEEQKGIIGDIETYFRQRSQITQGQEGDDNMDIDPQPPQPRSQSFRRRPLPLPPGQTRYQAFAADSTRTEAGLTTHQQQNSSRYGISNVSDLQGTPPWICIQT